jgi:hypothetical protein
LTRRLLLILALLGTGCGLQVQVRSVPERPVDFIPSGTLLRADEPIVVLDMMAFTTFREHLEELFGEGPGEDLQDLPETLEF